MIKNEIYLKLKIIKKKINFDQNVMNNRYKNYNNILIILIKRMIFRNKRILRFENN